VGGGALLDLVGEIVVCGDLAMGVFAGVVGVVFGAPLGGGDGVRVFAPMGLPRRASSVRARSAMSRVTAVWAR
jgi:hypothetical protein